MGRCTEASELEQDLRISQRLRHAEGGPQPTVGYSSISPIWNTMKHPINDINGPKWSVNPCKSPTKPRFPGMNYWTLLNHPVSRVNGFEWHGFQMDCLDNQWRFRSYVCVWLRMIIFVGSSRFSCLMSLVGLSIHLSNNLCAYAIVVIDGLKVDVNSFAVRISFRSK